MKRVQEVNSAKISCQDCRSNDEKITLNDMKHSSHGEIHSLGLYVMYHVYLIIYNVARILSIYMCVYVLSIYVHIK